MPIKKVQESWAGVADVSNVAQLKAQADKWESLWSGLERNWKLLEQGLDLEGIKRPTRMEVKDIRVSSKSNTKVYLVFLSSPSRGGRKGGVALGRFWKLLGNLAVLVLAMADALSMAKGFLPVMELPWALLLTMLVVPLVFVELEIPLLAGLELF